jgi:hypothetical protein
MIVSQPQPREMTRCKEGAAWVDIDVLDTSRGLPKAPGNTGVDPRGDCRSIVPAGIRVSRGRIASVNAVMTTGIAPYSVLLGIPAGLIRKRTDSASEE